MHGMPASDFPADTKREFMRLHSGARAAQTPADSSRHDELDKQIRAWPRTPKNDPYHFASMELAKELGRQAGCEVVLGYNEFCAPDCDEAAEIAAKLKPAEIVVVTPMLMRGGSHAESDIPSFIQRARARHPEIHFRYAWPFNTDRIAKFLSDQIHASSA